MKKEIEYQLVNNDNGICTYKKIRNTNMEGKGYEINDKSTNEW